MRSADLSRLDAARIAIRAADLDRRRASGPADVLERLGAVQLDTIAVLARSHELVAYARAGAVPRDAVEHAYWGAGRAFEYWSHAACILPMTTYPLFAFRRRAFARRPERWGADPEVVARVHAELRDRGPSTATDLGGARSEPGWWRWSAAKDALEWMLATGDVVVTERRAWRRVYDLAERAVPQQVNPSWVDVDGVLGPSDEDCVRELLVRSMRLLGVGTRDDLLDVHRLGGGGASTQHAGAGVVRAVLADLIAEGRIAEVLVEGMPWLADPDALRRIPRSPGSRTVALSPFDPLIWYRPRLERLFGVRMRIEAYTPRHLRTHGYFAMPVLHGDRIVGRIDPAREDGVLVARQVTLHDSDGEQAIASALAEAATWVGCTRVRVEAAPSAAMARRITSAAQSALADTVSAAAAPGSRRGRRP